MFKRRNPLPPFEKIRKWLWPRRGWVRASKYIMHRLSRLPGSGYSIACGFAFGAAISFTPFVGLHLVIAGALSWLAGGNVLAAWIGTLVGNPWTFPFIWLGLYKFGNWILKRRGADTDELPDFMDMFAHMWEAALSFDVTAFADGLSTVILPMAVAGIPCFIAAWLISYLVVRFLVDGYKHRRCLRLRKRQARRRMKHASVTPPGTRMAP